MATQRGKRPLLLLALIGVIALSALAAVYRGELWSAYLLRRDFERLRVNEQGFMEYRHTATGLVFVRLPDAALDKLGVSEGDVAPRILLVAKYEMSRAAWAKSKNDASARRRDRALPIAAVPPEEFASFAAANELRVPTVTEWRTAFRAGGGSSEGGSPRTRPGAVPVEHMGHDAIGVHGMLGNVSELCVEARARPNAWAIRGPNWVRAGNQVAALSGPATR